MYSRADVRDRRTGLAYQEAQQAAGGSAAGGADNIIDAHAALDLIERAVAGRGGTGARRTRHADVSREALALIRVGGENRAPAARHGDFRVVYFCGGTRVRLTLGAAVALRAARRADMIGSSGAQIIEDATYAAHLVLRLTPDRAVASAVACYPRSRRHREIVPAAPGSATGASGTVARPS